MILGIGSDLTDIRRIEEMLARHDERFKNRVFSDNELKYAGEKAKGVQKIEASILAKRFAAKEACSKAFGTGINHGVFLRDIEVVTNENGTPEINLSGGAAKRLKEITPQGMQAQINLSLSDEYPYAQAFVVISAVEG